MSEPSSFQHDNNIKPLRKDTKGSGPGNSSRVYWNPYRLIEMPSLHLHFRSPLPGFQEPSWTWSGLLFYLLNYNLHLHYFHKEKSVSVLLNELSMANAVPVLQWPPIRKVYPFMVLYQMAFVVSWYVGKWPSHISFILCLYNFVRDLWQYEKEKLIVMNVTAKGISTTRDPVIWLAKILVHGEGTGWGEPLVIPFLLLDNEFVAK